MLHTLWRPFPIWHFAKPLTWKLPGCLCIIWPRSFPAPLAPKAEDCEGPHLPFGWEVPASLPWGCICARWAECWMRLSKVMLQLPPISLLGNSPPRMEPGTWDREPPVLLYWRLLGAKGLKISWDLWNKRGKTSQMFQLLLQVPIQGLNFP